MKIGKTILGIGAMMATLALAPVDGAIIYDSSAQGELVGSRTETGGGIVTGGAWPGDGLNMTLAWNISFNAGVWSYEYTFTNFQTQANDISHFILDLSANCTDEDSLIDSLCVVDGGDPDDLEYGTFGPGAGEPGFPAAASIQGIKFDYGSHTYSFDSNRAPVYGDFYVKGGSSSFAYNPGLANHSSEDVNWFIARPDTTNGVIPEPFSMGLVGTGLIGLFFLRKRASRKA